MTENSKESSPLGDRSAEGVPLRSSEEAAEGLPACSESGPDSEAAPGGPRSDAQSPEPPVVIQASDEELSVDDEADIPSGTMVAERYRVGALIGRGGMGSVYQAEHVMMRKQVAIKVLHREMTALPEVVKRFEREAVAAGRIEHVNVAKATDFGQLDDGAFYLVLEHVEGKSLADLLVGAPFSVERTLNVVVQMARALAAAHAADIVHRDLKPDNVMIVPRGDDELVKVLDFGIAKVSLGALGTPITQMGSVFGTPEYMAPEQAAGQAVDHRADLYALGLLAYRMLAGETPFNAEEVSAVLMMQITAPLPQLPEHVPAALRDLVEHLLEKEPDARPRSAADVASRADLLLAHARAGTLDGMPVSRDARHLPTRKVRTQEARRSVRISGRAFPLWQLGAGAAGLVAVVVAIGSAVGGGESGAASPVSSASPAPVPSAPALASAPAMSSVEDTQLQKLISGAFQGDADAMRDLEKRNPATRGVSEWLALASGHSKLRNTAAALDAYERAITADSAVAEDPKFWRFMWGAVQKEETEKRALELAAEHGGPRGADLLYAAWVAMTKDETPATKLAKELVYRKDVRGKASPALGFALDMREAKTCERYAELLPRAALHGDTRSTRLLKRVRFKSACELPVEALDAAIAAVKERPAPTF